MEIIIVTGLSGAGKSQAAKIIEDLGFYCIDNMPPSLMADFINLTVNGSEDLKRVAFVMDIRGGEFFATLKDSIREIKESEYHCKILFFEASDEILIRRYKETRREHPLAKGGGIAEAIKREREIFTDIRDMSDYIVDTSNFRTPELRAFLSEIVVSEETAEDLTIVISSFGFKTGIPLDADFVFDVRFIPNPFYLKSMKKLTGNSRKVKEYVLKWPQTQEFLKRTYELLDYLIPFYIKEGKYSIVIGIGCTGGQHRSVTVANKLYEMLSEAGRRVIINHREL